MEERRGRRSGQVTDVTCRACDASVLLNPAKMVRKPTHAELRCQACGAVVRVRQTDVMRSSEGTWTFESSTGEAEPEPARIRHRFLRRAKAS